MHDRIRPRAPEVPPLPPSRPASSPHDRRRSRIVIPAVVYQHAEEAAALFVMRSALTAAPHARLRHLQRLDTRLAAHLDGLSVAGEQALPVCESTLARRRPVRCSRRLPGPFRTRGRRSIRCFRAQANWLNMIDAQYVDQLGGLAAIEEKLAAEPLGDAVGIHPFAGGGVILSSGDAPQLCENNQPMRPPRVYRPVARLLKPLRTPRPWECWGCPKEESLERLDRLD